MKSRIERQALTTTSFALLGLLSIKPWTTYELAGQMDKGLGKFWPRARSMLFKEPQKLVALGLAEASSEHVGRRARTVYTITPAGRLRLTAWLSTPGDGPVLEWEQLVKVFFAESGSKEDLLATLAAVRSWSDERLRYQRAKAQTYLDGVGTFPERAAITSLTGSFLAEFEALVGSWATRAQAIVETWPADIHDAQPDRRIIERVAKGTPLAFDD